MSQYGVGTLEVMGRTYNKEVKEKQMMWFEPKMLGMLGRFILSRLRGMRTKACDGHDRLCARCVLRECLGDRGRSQIKSAELNILAD